MDGALCDMNIDSSLIVLLIAFILINIQAFYFGFINPPKTSAWLQQSSFIVLTFLLIPILAYIIYSQAGSISRLEAHEIEAHPAISNAVGFNNGYDKNPTWVFELTRNEQNVLSFYKQRISTSKWKLVEETGLYLRWKQEGKLLTIAHQISPSKNTLTIIINYE